MSMGALPVRFHQITKHTRVVVLNYWYCARGAKVGRRMQSACTASPNAASRL
jgi:hypothetical protein